MLDGLLILFVSFAYLCILFAIAYYGDKRADEGRSLINNPYVYALSIAVYCTSWTFYGSVGRAASSGIDFLAIYVGPTLTFCLWWVLLAKIIRISKAHRITSIADFIASRYGKSTILGGLVTIIAVVGIMPYISLQLKAVSTSFGLLLYYPDIVMPEAQAQVPFLGDTSLLLALSLAAFAILFGTRHIDASEHHEGMVAAVAFESIVKLVAFLAVGLFVTFWLFDGFGDLFAKAAESPDIKRLFTAEGMGSYSQWVTLTILSMAAIICLPRQFQVTVVENINEGHLRKAVWLFPLYLLIINIFVLPIAVSGIMHFPGGEVNADTFVLTIPMAEHQESLALLAYIGGLSAATAMVIFATIALSTMVCNDLVMPVLLRLTWLRLTERGDLTRLLLAIRRGSIFGVVLLGYTYYRFIGESYALATIGLVSFAAAAQFAPAIIAGIYWKGATLKGAFTGLSLGFLMWTYTLLLPSFARSGWLPIEFVNQGLFGIPALKPYELFGLTGLDPLSHSFFWSMLLNIGGLIWISLLTRQSAIERVQAALFVDVMRHSGEQGGTRFWRGTATISDLRDLLGQFLGRNRTDRAILEYASRHGMDLAEMTEADADFVSFAERLLAGAIGAASARVMIGNVVKGEIIGLDEVMKILDEASQIIEYSHRLEEQSLELERASSELRAANLRLQELDRLKDDFLTTVSHELRTPLTSIRSFSEILQDNENLGRPERRKFLSIIIRESERLTRLINQILDLAKMEAGRMEWQMVDVDPKDVIDDALAVTSGLFAERGIRLDLRLPDQLPRIHADRDRLMQVIVNLLSNAVNVCDERYGRVWVEATVAGGNLRIDVVDNGPGVPSHARQTIFEKFRQGPDTGGGKPGGTGLGLSICRQIMDHFDGHIWVEDAPDRGARFSISLPYVPVSARAPAPAAS